MDIFEAFKKLGVQQVSITTTNPDNTLKELIKLDCTPNETHTITNVVTEHPLEDGSVISDHIIRKPKTLSLTGIISDDPINLSSTLVGNIAGIGSAYIGSKLASIKKVGKFAPALGAAANATFSLIGNAILSESKRRSVSNYQVLEDAADQGLILTIHTSLKTYDKMVIESISVPRDSKNSNALYFTATFKEIVVATTKVVSIPENVRKILSGASKKEIGKVPITDLDSATQNKGDSWAHGIATSTGLVTP